MTIEDSNIHYYDAISNKYNQTVVNTIHHTTIRKQVASNFKSKIHQGTVLDFGGGTGLDLEWLHDAGYRIYFFEPSIGMRSKALEMVTKNNLSNITFINNLSDLFPNKVDGVLANFAVMNSIEEISKTFKELSTITNSNALIYLLVINPNSFKFWSSIKYLRKRLAYYLLNKTITFNLTTDTHRHCVYIHQLDDYRNKAKEWFKLKNITKLGGYGFLLLQFERK
jgi:2-polyprenyl-3-methyl-5-hydroxy-6-metoxy-1,4-benzoquinol methylase